MIDDLPAAPDPASDTPKVFSDKAAAMVLAQKAMVPQINAAVGSIAAFAAGGAYALAYSFDSGTADADPGPGKLRLSNATQNTSTVLRLDTLVGGQDYTSIIDAFDASSSAVKGSIRLVKIGDPTKWLTFDVTARTAPSGYRNLTVVNTGGSSASPFVAGDGVMLFFTRNGDAGTPIIPAYNRIAGATLSASAATIDFLNIFNSTYDRYVIELSNWQISQAANLRLQPAALGQVQTPNYYGSNDGLGGVNVNAISTVAGDLAPIVLEIANVNSDGATRKIITTRGGYIAATDNSWYSYTPAIGVGNVSALSGFRLALSGGFFTKGKINVYGIRNS